RKHAQARNLIGPFCIVRCTLGTDMAKHTDMVEAFTARMVEHWLRGENSEDNQSVATIDAVNGVTAPKRLINGGHL
uniref:tRNA dihydrouridine synthase DusB n=1 Tax=Mesocestoides corti TaxID=53468 RepID=A0A5K3FZH3_MESCO